MNDPERAQLLKDALREIAALAASHTPDLDPVRDTLAGIALVAERALAKVRGTQPRPAEQVRQSIEKLGHLRLSVEVMLHTDGLAPAENSPSFHRVYLGDELIGRLVEIEIPSLDGTLFDGYRPERLFAGKFEPLGGEPVLTAFDGAQRIAVALLREVL